MTKMGLVFQKREWSLNGEFLECIHYDDDGCGSEFTDDCCIYPNYMKIELNDSKKLLPNDNDLATIPSTAYTHQRSDSNQQDPHKLSHFSSGKKREWEGGMISDEIPLPLNSHHVHRTDVPVSKTGANRRHSLHLASGHTIDALECCWLDCNPTAIEGLTARGRRLNAESNR
jgi:hypothetical protein